MAGADLFAVPLTISIASGTKGYCNRYCGRGQLFGILGWTLRTITEKGYSQVDEKQMVSVRFPDFLFCDVFSDALEYLFGFCRSAGLKTSRNTCSGHSNYLGIGHITEHCSIRALHSLRWLLQRDADFDRAWTDYDGTV